MFDANISDTNTGRVSGDINVPSSLVPVGPYFPSRRAPFIRFRGRNSAFLYLSVIFLVPESVFFSACRFLPLFLPPRVIYENIYTFNENVLNEKPSGPIVSLKMTYICRVAKFKNLNCRTFCRWKQNLTGQNWTKTVIIKLD